MTKQWKKIIAVTLCAMLVFTMSGCNNISVTEDSDAYLELVDSPFTTLDNVWYNPGGIFRCAVFESLLISNADMTELQPALAKKYTISQDEMTYTFELKRNVTWHDGEKLDVADVLFSIKTALRTDEINGLFSSVFQCIEGAEQYSLGETDELSGVTIDNNSIIFQLNAPNSRFLKAIAQFAILPEHILKDVSPKDLPTHDFWKQPVGCGCYKITEAVEEQYFILEAYEDYYGKAAGIRKIRLRLNEEDCVQAMKEGRLDFYITNDPEEMAELKGVETCSEYALNIMFPAYLIMNISNDAGVNEQLKDVRVREALLLAIDRNTIVDALFPRSSVTDTLIPSWDSWYSEDITSYSFDPEKAKEILDEVGFDYSKTIRLRYSTKGKANEDLMNSIAVYWRAIGLNVNVEKFEGSGSDHMFNIRDYDVCYKRLSAFDYLSIYEEVGGNSVMQTKIFNQPIYDDLLKELASTMNVERQQEIIQEMQALDQEYLLRIPLFSLTAVAYVNENHFDMPDAYGNLWYRYDLHFNEWKLVR